MTSKIILFCRYFRLKYPDMKYKYIFSFYTFWNKQEFKNKLSYKPWLHLCNTSGVLNYPEAHFDMVRCGIGLHGYANEPNYDALLKPLSTLKTTISQIHQLEKGQFVGYNFGHCADKSMKVATLAMPLVQELIFI